MCVCGCKLWLVKKETTFLVGHLTTIYGHFIAKYINILRPSGIMYDQNDIEEAILIEIVPINISGFYTLHLLGPVCLFRTPEYSYNNLLVGSLEGVSKRSRLGYTDIYEILKNLNINIFKKF